MRQARITQTTRNGEVIRSVKVSGWDLQKEVGRVKTEWFKPDAYVFVNYW